jgi:hypothetical protein
MKGGIEVSIQTEVDCDLNFIHDLVFFIYRSEHPNWSGQITKRKSIK